MSKQSFAPKSDHKRDLWLKNFAGKLPTYGAKYGLSVEEVKDMIACALFFTYWLDYQNRVVDYDQKVTNYKNKMRDGVEADSVPPVQPGAPDTGVIPPTVVPGIFNRANSRPAISNGTERAEPGKGGFEFGVLGFGFWVWGLGFGVYRGIMIKRPLCDIRM